MNLKCKVLGRGTNLMQALEMRGYTPRKYNNSVVFYLVKKNGKHQIPVKKYLLFIETTEVRDEKKAFVVCGTKGQKIKPYYYPFFLCDKRAYFHGEKLCTVKAYSNNLMVTVTRHEVVVNNGYAQIISKIIWSGSLKEGEELPLSVKPFYAAIRAAKEKAFCRNCSCTHYAAL